MSQYRQSQIIGQLYIFYEDASHTEFMYARVLARDMGRELAANTYDAASCTGDARRAAVRVALGGAAVRAVEELRL